MIVDYWHNQSIRETIAVTLKKPYSTVGWVALFMIAVVLLPEGKVYAYLDPGSGSLIIQILVAGFLGALVTFRVFWQRIIGLFGKAKDSETDDELQDKGDG